MVIAVPSIITLRHMIFEHVLLSHRQSTSEVGVPPLQRSWSNYLLRHAIAHACLGQKCREVLSDFGFWQLVFQSGHGPCVLRDLALMMPPSWDLLAHDLIRWGRGHLDYLIRYPRSALQLACDSPSGGRLNAQGSADEPMEGMMPSSRLINRSMTRPLWEWSSLAKDCHQGGRTMCIDWDVSASMVSAGDGAA